MVDLTNISRARLGDHLDPELMFRFFAAFSRFEYALKEAGFRKSTTTAAKPDWNRFAQAIAEPFNNQIARDGALKAAVDELVAHPPRGERPDLGWVAVAHQGDPDGALNVLHLVLRVRNNLFHGGKAQRLLADGERDNRLVANALLVLDRALACHDRVRERFVEC